MGKPFASAVFVRALAGGRAIRGKQRFRKIVTHYFPFRMPLHGGGETLRAAHAKGLDDPVWRARFDEQPVRETLDALVMKRVHANAIAAGESAQHAALFEQNIVRR